MVTYSIGHFSYISPVPAIQGFPSFKGLWDTHKTLVTQLCKIKHPDHPHQVMAGGMMSPKAFALVSTTPWETPKRMGQCFVVLITAITDTDQRTAER